MDSAKNKYFSNDPRARRMCFADAKKPTVEIQRSCANW